MIIVKFIRMELTPILFASSLTNVPLACLCVAIHTFPLLTFWSHSFSYKIEEKVYDTIQKISIFLKHYIRFYSIMPHYLQLVDPHYSIAQRSFH